MARGRIQAAVGLVGAGAGVAEGVLDGVSRTGQGAFNFGWLGASTPLSDEAWKALAAAGPKLFFFDVTRRHRSAEELARSMAASDDDMALQEVHR